MNKNMPLAGTFEDHPGHPVSWVSKKKSAFQVFMLHNSYAYLQLYDTEKEELIPLERII